MSYRSASASSFGTPSESKSPSLRSSSARNASPISAASSRAIELLPLAEDPLTITSRGRFLTFMPIGGPPCRNRTRGREPLAPPLAQQPRRRGLVPQLQVRLVERDLGRAAGREAAVGVEGDPPGVDVPERLLDPSGDLARRVDVLAAAVDAAEPDQPVVRQSAQSRHVAGDRNRELERVLVDL